MLRAHYFEMALAAPLTPATLANVGTRSLEEAGDDADMKVESAKIFLGNIKTFLKIYQFWKTHIFWNFHSFSQL